MLAHLRIGEAVVTVASVEARIARCLPFAQTAEERLEGALYPQHHILQDLRVDLGVFGQRFFDARQFGLLLVVRDADTAHAPRFAPFPYSSVVDVTAEHERTIKRPLLFRRGFEFVLVGLADALLFHRSLFCLIGEKPATVRRGVTQ